MKFLIFLSFIAVTNGIKIGCNFGVNKKTKLYSCAVASLDFSDNPTTVTEVRNLLANDANSKEKFEKTYEIYFPRQKCRDFNLKIVPKGFLDFFPNFSEISFIGCAINSLNGDELEEYPKLESWVLSNSNLSSVPGNFFTKTPNMRIVDFGGNKISKVGKGLLNGLSELRKVFFRKNVCIDENAVTRKKIDSLIEKLEKNCL